MTNSMQQPKTVRLVWLGSLVAILLGLLALRGPAQQMLSEHFVLRSPAPDEESFLAVSADAADPVAFLSRSWRDGGIPHRQLVVRQLSQIRQTAPAESQPAIDRILAEAAIDPDLSVRAIALS